MASRMICVGSTLSKKSLAPGCDRSSIFSFTVGMGQSGRGGAGGGEDVGAMHVVAGNLGLPSCGQPDLTQFTMVTNEDQTFFGGAHVNVY